MVSTGRLPRYLLNTIQKHAFLGGLESPPAALVTFSKLQLCLLYCSVLSAAAYVSSSALAYMLAMLSQTVENLRCLAGESKRPTCGINSSVSHAERDHEDEVM